MHKGPVSAEERERALARISAKMIGQVFGKLRVESFSHTAPEHKPRRYWLCRCECGNTVTRCTEQLKSSSYSPSCKDCHRKHLAQLRFKHGQSHTPLHGIWIQMRARCTDPNLKQYKHYGGRGITYDPRWEDFSIFAAEVGERPSSEHSIDRIDVNGNYDPGNVRWATDIEQMRNMRKNRYFTFQGKTQCLSAWAEELAINYGTLETRLGELNWPVERAFTEPTDPMRFSYHDRQLTLAELSRETGMSVSRLRAKICYSGMTPEQAAIRLDTQGRPLCVRP